VKIDVRSCVIPELCVRLHVFALGTVLAIVLAGGCGAKPKLPRQVISHGDGEVTIDGDVWADNWLRFIWAKTC